MAVYVCYVQYVYCEYYVYYECFFHIVSLGETASTKKKQRLHAHPLNNQKWGVDYASKFSPYEAILQKLCKLEKVKLSPATHIPNIFL